MRIAIAVLLALFTFKENSLRASPDDGPRRLAALMAEKGPEISHMKAELARGVPEPGFAHLRAEIDAAAHQKDAAWSGLYWYTSLPQALAAAKREGKPILSLRLLGRLDEELSCANSRFFRTALYANEAISKELRENWILHWESVRPAPKITIDYGDGRVLTRTITGNSLHYVLDTDGRARDVLPGLWTPKEFLRMVRGARETLARGANGGAAAAAASVAASGRAGAPSKPFEESLSPSSSGVLDSNSRSLMRVKAPHGLDDPAFARLVALFEASLGADSVRNASLRTVILPWLADARSAADLPALTDRIYRDAFLTPRSDPWLGLLPEVYTALEGDPKGVAAPDARIAGGLALTKKMAQQPLVRNALPGNR